MGPVFLCEEKIDAASAYSFRKAQFKCRKRPRRAKSWSAEFTSQRTKFIVAYPRDKTDKAAFVTCVAVSSSAYIISLLSNQFSPIDLFQQSATELCEPQC